MRIFSLNESGADHWGGVEVYCQQLNKMLEAGGHHVRFFEVIDEGKKKNKYRAFLDSLFSIKYYRIIKKEIESLQPDIVLAHSFLSIITPSFLVITRRMGLPVVITVHGFAPWTPPRLIMKRPLRIISWVVFWLHMEIIKRNVDYFICPSEALAKHIMRVLNIGREKVGVIPYPIEWPNPRVVAERNVGGNIVYVGRFSELKGIEYLVGAMPSVIKRHSNARLHIYGDGEERRDIECLVNASKLTSNVIFHGYVPHEDLIDLYWRADTLVLPSIIPEAFGLTILEAMSQKVPVITTNIGGQAELVKHGYNGFLVKPKDPDELAEKINAILDNPKLAKEMGENGRKMVERDYIPEKHLARMLEIFHSLVRQKHAR